MDDGRARCTTYVCYAISFSSLLQSASPLFITYFFFLIPYSLSKLLSDTVNSCVYSFGPGDVQ